MVVQHNLRAMNSNRMLGLTQGTQAKSTEKLSSGFKINRAADDAAGLSISEISRILGQDSSIRKEVLLEVLERMMKQKKEMEKNILSVRGLLESI